MGFMRRSEHGNRVLHELETLIWRSKALPFAAARGYIAEEHCEEWCGRPQFCKEIRGLVWKVVREAT